MFTSLLSVDALPVFGLAFFWGIDMGCSPEDEFLVEEIEIKDDFPRAARHSNPAQLADGPYQSLGHGCYRRLPCSGSDNFFGAEPNEFD